MKQPMVTTNVRMPQSDYLQVKTMAAELGMSVNEYINSIIISSATKRMMQSDKQTRKSKKQDFYTAMLELAQSITPKKPIDLSDEDKIIYGL